MQPGGVLDVVAMKRPRLAPPEPPIPPCSWPRSPHQLNVELCRSLPQPYMLWVLCLLDEPLVGHPPPCFQTPALCHSLVPRRVFGSPERGRAKQSASDPHQQKARGFPQAFSPCPRPQTSFLASLTMLWLWRMLRAGWDPWLELQQQETAWMRKGDRCCPQSSMSLLFISFFFFFFG